MGPRMEPWVTPHGSFEILSDSRIFSLVSFQVSTTTGTSSRNRSSSTKPKDLVNYQQTTGFHTETIRRWAIKGMRERT